MSVSRIVTEVFGVGSCSSAYWEGAFDQLGREEV